MRSEQKGMTLVEVIIASVILSIITLGLITAMRTFAGTYAAADQLSSKSLAVRQAVYFLRHSLRQAIFPGVEALKTDGQELIWLAPLDRIGSAGGVSWHRLQLEEGSLMLHFASQSEEGDIEGVDSIAWDETIKPQRLFEGLNGFSVTLLQHPDEPWISGDNADITSLPNALKLEFDLDGAPWPPLVVTLDAYQGLRR